MLSLGYIVNASRRGCCSASRSARRSSSASASSSSACGWWRDRSAPFLPFARPTIDEATIADVADMLRSRWIASGPRVAAFEEALSERFGGRPVRVLTSATARDAGRARAARRRARRRGDHAGAELLRHRQHDRAHRRDDGVRRRRPRHAQPRPRAGRGRGRRRARACSCRRTTTRRSIPTRSRAFARAPRRARDRGRRARDRLARAAASPVGAIGDLVVVQLPSEQEHHDDRGRRAGGERRARGARGRASCASTASRACPTARATSSAPAASSTCSDVTARLGLRAARAPRRLVPRARRALAARYFELPRGRRPAHARAPAAARQPGPQLEHVHACCCRSPRPRITRKAFVDAMQARGIGIGISYEAIHLTTLFRALGLPRGAVPGLRAHRARDRDAAALPRDDATPTSSACARACAACCAARRA